MIVCNLKNNQLLNIIFLLMQNAWKHCYHVNTFIYYNVHYAPIVKNKAQNYTFINRFLSLFTHCCSQVKDYFVQDYDSAALHPETLWGKPLFQRLITLHPIKQPEHIYSVHQYYTILSRQTIHKSLVEAQNTIVELCSKIPLFLLPQKLHICPEEN